MAISSFHNSVNAEGVQLDIFDQKARSDEIRIKNYFKLRKRKLIIPEEVRKALYPDNPMKIISIRRAMNNLANPNYRDCCLIRTEEKKKGDQGRLVGCYMMK